MAIFNSYVKVPEGNMGLSENRLPQEIHWFNIIFKHALFWGTFPFPDPSLKAEDVSGHDSNFECDAHKR